MYEMDWNDPMRIRSWRDLLSWINEIGFLPLFKNEIEGFSVEEHTSNLFWWTGDPEQDPWEWRELIARSHEVAYGKFFGKKSAWNGFRSLRITAETVMILMPDGMMSWPISLKFRLI